MSFSPSDRLVSNWLTLLTSQNPLRTGGSPRMGQRNSRVIESTLKPKISKEVCNRSISGKSQYKVGTRDLLHHMKMIY